MPDKPCIEWAPFRTREGVSEDALLQASLALQDSFLSHQPGFRRRELLRGASDRDWVDLVVWKDRASADRAMLNAAQSPACKTYFQLMEEADAGDPAAGVLLLTQVGVYDGMRTAA